jgi:hypothetical protein
MASTILTVTDLPQEPVTAMKVVFVRRTRRQYADQSFNLRTARLRRLRS